MRIRDASRLLLVGLVATTGLALAACGDDDGGGVDVVAMDFEGYWRFDAVRLYATDPFVCGDEDGCEIRVTDDTSPFSLVGNVDVVAVDDAAMDLRARLLFLLDGLLTDVPEVMVADVALEPAARRWVIGDQGDVDVYRFELSGDELALTFDLDDPRNDPVADGTLLEIDVVRGMRPAGWSVGDWRVAEMTMRGETREVGACVPIDEGVWGVEDVLFTIDEDWLFDQRFVRQAYLDDACTQPTGPAEMEPMVGAVVEGEDTIGFHELDEDGSEPGFIAFDAESIAADRLVLARTGCRPVERGCLGDTPERVTLARIVVD